MLPVERLHAAVTFAAYDRPPFCDNEWNECLADLVPSLAGCPPEPGRRYDEASRAAAVAASMDMLPWCHVYDHPRYPVLGPLPADQGGRRWVDEDGFTWVVDGYSEWVVGRPFADLAGFLDFLDRKCHTFPMTSSSLAPDFAARLAYARCMLAPCAIGLPYEGLGLDDLYRLAGWDLLAAAVIEQPGALAAYLAGRAALTAQQVHLYAEHVTAADCPVALIYSDIAGNNGLLLSPRFLRYALLPAVSILVQAYHEHGIKVVYHSEGDVRQILPDLIAAGVDGINPLSPSENMDPVAIRALYPGLILWGGVNERTVLVDGSVEDVAVEVARVVGGVGAGLILGSTGGVHPACRPANCVAMVRAAQRKHPPAGVARHDPAL